MADAADAMDETLHTLAWALLVCLTAAVFLPAVRSTYPSYRMAGALAATAIVSLALLFWHGAVAWLCAVELLGVGVLVWDAVRLPPPGAFRAERRLARVASLNRRHHITVILQSNSARSWHATLRDDLSEDMGLLPADVALVVPAQQSLQWQYTWTPQRRGSYRLERVHVKIRSPLGFWHRYYRLPAISEVHVYPNIRQLDEFSLLARTNRLSLLGVRRSRRWGEDHDFERLRDYTRDDNYRHIDWRATARRRRLTVKVYQSSQNQRLMLMVDCGRMMVSQSGTMSLVDHALDAALLLAYCALQQGDAVGLMCFSDRVAACVPPRSGRRHMRLLMHAAFDQRAACVESRYDAAFMQLKSLCRKRALVVLITNVVDRVNAQQIERYLGVERERHLTMAVLLRDPALYGWLPAERPARAGSPEWYRAAAAADIALWRDQVVTQLSRDGHLVLDVTPEGLRAELISQYLRIKAAHWL